ncbi:hypothetical protein, partial [Klebsiella pneumoniae]|uniref:hypothetical protein n=1 Tax=Klebsiella pneumoniae TaxID=573 RepID=UPI003AF4F8B7
GVFDFDFAVHIGGVEFCVGVKKTASSGEKCWKCPESSVRDKKLLYMAICASIKKKFLWTDF